VEVAGAFGPEHLTHGLEVLGGKANIKSRHIIEAPPRLHLPDEAQDSFCLWSGVRLIRPQGDEPFCLVQRALKARILRETHTVSTNQEAVEDSHLDAPSAQQIDDALLAA
jgi:hypothetical protein